MTVFIITNTKIGVIIQNRLEYLNFNLHTPEFYDRDFANDLPANDDDIGVQFGAFNLANAKRATLIALPFIMQYSGPGKVFSLTMNSCRTAYNISNIYAADFLSYDQFANLFQLTLSVMSIAGTVFSFKMGMAITSSADALGSLSASISHLSEGEYAEAMNDLLHAATSILYLYMMINGSLEITLACLLLKACSSFYDCAAEFHEERYYEAFAKFAMGMIRLKGAHTQLGLIQRRDFLNSMDKFQDLLMKIHQSKKIDSLYDHPLTSLSTKIEDGKVIFQDDDGNSYDFGSHFSCFGGGMIKGMNLTFTTTEESTVMEFKVNHAYRAKIAKQIDALLKSQENPEDMKDFLALNKAPIDNLEISIDEKKMGGHNFMSPSLKTYWNIDLGEGKSISVGASKDFINSYDKIKVTLPKGENFYDLHAAFTMLGMEEALRESTSEDLERMKLLHLFHTLSPEKAFTIERRPEAFDVSIDHLKKGIIHMDPSMEEKIDTYLNKMELKDILPGRKRFHIEGLAADLQKTYGDFHLTSILTGIKTNEECFKRFSSIMQMGMLSKEMKITAGICKEGLHSDGDAFGAIDSTFAQVITSQKSYNNLLYTQMQTHQGRPALRILFDPEAINSGTYEYDEDMGGHRDTKEDNFTDLLSWFFDKTCLYQYRKGIEEFIEGQFNHPTEGHEVMLKDRIDPKHVRGVVLENEKMKQGLLDYLAAHGHYKDGQIFGRDADTFIQVGQDVKSAEAVV